MDVRVTGRYVSQEVGSRDEETVNHWKGEKKSNVWDRTDDQNEEGEECEYDPIVTVKCPCLVDPFSNGDFILPGKESLFGSAVVVERWLSSQ